MFDKTIGMWNTAPVSLELKYDAIPVCLQPYPVHRVHEENFRKEIDGIVIQGVLKEANEPEWVAPSFAQPKPKTDSIIF